MLTMVLKWCLRADNTLTKMYIFPVYVIVCGTLTLFVHGSIYMSVLSFIPSSWLSLCYPSVGMTGKIEGICFVFGFF